ncbi:MAG: hypothetical protein Q9174_003781 [Haloplaca sp. 1 TL-2023]
MVFPKPMRALALASTVVLIYIIFITLHKPPQIKEPRIVYPDMKTDPNLDETHEPSGKLFRASDGDYSPNSSNSARINATILTLVRNSEIDGIIQSMRDLERTWNSKFNYPWTFFNDVPFTEEFKTRTSAETNASCHYEIIPREHWAVPGWIDPALYHDSAAMMNQNQVQYAGLVSYHQMCRWNSGMFYHHPALRDTRYYWRVEPHVHFFCDVDYDVFRYMQDNEKTYGFTINLYDSPQSMPTLWPQTMDFVNAHPEYLKNGSNAQPWLEDKQRRPEHNKDANGYSTCHFWSNFEVADMEFWRSKPYEDYFNHLDRSGGFFYERWGDAPVHSIALGLFEDASKIHWFRDIGYQHIPYFNCPNSPKCSGCKKGMFTDGEDFLYKEDCRPNWFKYVGMG